MADLDELSKCQELAERIKEVPNYDELMVYLKKVSGCIDEQRDIKIKEIQQMEKYVDEFNLKYKDAGISMDIRQLLGLEEYENPYEEFVCKEYGHVYRYFKDNEEGYRCYDQFKCKLCGKVIWREKLPGYSLLSVSGYADTAQRDLDARSKRRARDRKS